MKNVPVHAVKRTLASVGTAWKTAAKAAGIATYASAEKDDKDEEVAGIKMPIMEPVRACWRRRGVRAQAMVVAIK